MPFRLQSPTVGLTPTTPQDDDGHTIDPLVSVPIASAARLADTPAAEPELDPHGFRCSAYGFAHCPPRPLQPLELRCERKFAHSLRLAFPRMTAPASLNFRTIVASCGGIDPSSASDPAVVVIRSAVPMLSLIRIGTPCRGPRARPAVRSASRLWAIWRASGFVSSTDRSSGPWSSIAAIRSRYISVISTADQRPDAMPSCRSSTVSSSSSKVGTSQRRVSRS